MATSSKILTVTYGTFSCTLEGFDDPFTTLQMVAEYFRKLAAEDRYFGGTPQTPDAETLRRIAENSNSHGIDAEVADDGIILRQSDAQTVATPLDDEVATIETVPSDIITSDTATSDTATSDISLNTPTDDIESAATHNADLLQPTEEEEAILEPATPDPDTSEREPHKVEIPHQDVLKGALLATTIGTVTSALVLKSNADTEADEAEAEAETDDTSEEILETDFVADESLDEAEVEAEAEAEVDEVIEEAVEDDISQDAAIVDVEEAPEDLINEGEVEDANVPLDDQIPDAIADTDIAEDTTEQNDLVAPMVTEASTEEDTLASPPETQEAASEILIPETVITAPLTYFRSSRRSAPEAAKITTDTDISLDVPLKEEDIAAPMTPSATSVEETLAAIRRNVREAETADVTEQDAPSESHLETLDELGDEVAAPETAEADDTLVLNDAIAPETELENVAVEPFQEEIAEAAETESEALPTLQEEADLSEIAETVETTLSDEDEADLQRELDEALTEQPSDEVETAEDTAEETRRQEHRARAEALRSSEDLVREEAALDRLLETTRTKMGKPDQVRRVNALDQLKAAVAATEADKDLKGDTTDDAETADLAAYRDDLKRAKTTTRFSGFSAAEAQQAATQAPLILVSEQRIDEQHVLREDEGMPVQPTREIAETDGNLALKREPETQGVADEDGEIQGIPADAFDASNSFSDFAERIGAFELQDLLEAAAAYTSIVEGKPRFSRAQVMSKIARLDTNDAFSKEAGLRSFGRLLREGKILRVQDGQFAISKASRFSIASRHED